MDSEERHKWSTDERAILQRLDLLLREPSVQETINSLARISHQQIAKGCHFWHKRFGGNELCQRRRTAF